MSGEKIVDVYLPTRWHENPCLEGAYNITVFLKGPYDNVTVLFHRIFNLKMALTATVAPASWHSWAENITIRVTNTGDVPVILQGVGMELTGTGTVIGWVYAPTLESSILAVMPGETKTWAGTPTMAGDFKEKLAGKTFQVDFILDIVGGAKTVCSNIECEFSIGSLGYPHCLLLRLFCKNNAPHESLNTVKLNRLNFICAQRGISFLLSWVKRRGFSYELRRKIIGHVRCHER